MEYFRIKLYLLYSIKQESSGKMSSSEQCTYQACQCQQNYIGKRAHNFCASCQNSRQHPGKRRFPPRKKEQFLKDHSQKAKYQMRRGGELMNFYPEENKNIGATPSKYQKGEVNPIAKLNANTTFGIDQPYHAVGQSQREKLMGVSPSPSAHINFDVENKGAPFTDRDRRIFSGSNLRNNMVNIMRKKDKVKALDANFLKNFANPENLLTNLAEKPTPSVNLLRQGSASVQK